MEALGRLFDIVPAFTPVDLNTNDGATGLRVHLKNCTGVTFVFFKGAGTAGADPDLAIKQHTAASSGTTADLAVATHFYRKEEATLDADETWTKVSQSASATVDLGDASAEVEGLYVVEISANSLSDGYEWVSVNVAATAANAQLGAGLYILHGLNVQRAPAKLVQPQA
ncbi:hypothetical protein [Nonomuraea bangladeshensis]|uniref:hypothetical protein n=1 Tax=Nonomuraea bangladeshensis TaxID=404385 RepID=UPI0031DD7000